MASEMSNLTRPEVSESGDTQAALAEGCNIVMDRARRHTARCTGNSRSWDETQQRWQKLLSRND